MCGVPAASSQTMIPAVLMSAFNSRPARVATEVESAFVVHQAERHLFEEAAPPEHVVLKSLVFGECDERAELQTRDGEIDFVQVRHETARHRPHDLAEAAGYIEP